MKPKSSFARRLFVFKEEKGRVRERVENKERREG